MIFYMENVMWILLFVGKGKINKLNRGVDKYDK